MKNLHIVEHPLVQHKISMLRNEETGSKEFREIVQEVAAFICYEATRDIPLVDVDINTPMGQYTLPMTEIKFGIVPILRAGIGMVDGILTFLPTAKVGHIGIYRDPDTLLPKEYYCKLPSDAAQREILLVDPMLATGGSAAYAISCLKKAGVKNIKFLCLISAPDGVNKISQLHPDVQIYTAAFDNNPLNSHGYIIPGLGDAGDRLFGTK